jgi:uncharacterized protein
MTRQSSQRGFTDGRTRIERLNTGEIPPFGAEGRESYHSDPPVQLTILSFSQSELVQIPIQSHRLAGPYRHLTPLPPCPLTPPLSNNQAPMISLQKIFGKTDVFYDLLEASAEEARTSVQALAKLISQNPGERSLEALILSRQKDKKITQQIDEALCRTFVTDLEREDVEALSNALYKIPKTVEKIAERILIAPDRLKGVDFTTHLKMMQEAVDTVVTTVHELRRKLHLERVKDHCAKLHYIEGEADKLMVEMLRDLYSGRHECITVVFLKDLYDLMEKVYDRCRDSGNVVSHIVLKYS